MQLNKNTILKIVEKNFNCKIVNTYLGEGFVLNSYDAFIFSSITGSGYLDNPILPFTPKGLVKIFYNAFAYNLITGIFDNIDLKNTPYYMSLSRPYIFSDGNKIIVPIEFDNELELQNMLQETINNIQNPTKILVLRIDKSKKGFGMENFLEYCANQFFVSEGFICENQIPLTHSFGSPDFGGYGIPKLFSELNKKNIFNNGFNILELSMLRIRVNRSINLNTNTKIIVGEAKTSTKNMSKQLNKYLNLGVFDFGFEMHPSKNKPDDTHNGLLSFDDNYAINYFNPSFISDKPNTSLQKDYIHWVENYMKFYLIANLTNQEFLDYYQKVTNNIPKNKNDITSFVINLEFIDILESLEEYFGTV